MNYTIFIRFTARELKDYDNPAFRAKTIDLAEDFKRQFVPRMKEVTIRGVPVEPPHHSVSQITAVTDKPEDYFTVHNWLVASSDSPLMANVCGGFGPKDGASIALARWLELPLEAGWVDYDRTAKRALNEYRSGCDVCGAADVDHPPDPIKVHRSISEGHNAKREIFPALNGILVVTPKVRDLFSSLIPSEFIGGKVVVDSLPKLDGQYCWIRPKAYLGERLGQKALEPICPKCGRPDRVVLDQNPATPGGLFLTHFGDSKSNIALVGKVHYTHIEDLKRNMPRPHSVAVSGGLFAALYNHGIKGISWTDTGPFYSKLTDEPAFEGSRRFPDLFKGAKDKAVKFVPK